MSENLTPEQVNAMATIKRIQTQTGFDPHTGTGKDFEMLVSEYMQEHKVTRGKAMLACARLYPEQHENWIRQTNS